MPVPHWTPVTIKSPSWACLALNRKGPGRRGGGVVVVCYTTLLSCPPRLAGRLGSGFGKGKGGRNLAGDREHQISRMFVCFLAGRACLVGVVVVARTSRGPLGGPCPLSQDCRFSPVWCVSLDQARQEYTTRLDVLLHKPLVDQMTAPRATGGIGRGTTALRVWGGTKGGGAMWVSCRGILMGFYTECEMRAVWWCSWCSWCWVRVGLLDFGGGGLGAWSRARKVDRYAGRMTGSVACRTRSM